MKRVLRPNVLTPFVLGLGLIAALLAIGDAHKIAQSIVTFPRSYLVYFFCLMLAYEAVRCLQWIFLVVALGVRVPLRAQIFAFITGEAMKSLPVGHYVQSYLLARSRDQNLGRLSAAASFIIWIEAAVAMVGVVMLGLGGWTSWLRPLIVGALLGITLLVWLLTLVPGTPRAPGWLRDRPTWRGFVEALRHFIAGTKDLMRPRVLAVAVPLGAIYLALGGAGLFVIVLGLDQSQPHTGLANVTFLDTLAVYLFSLAIGLLFPVPVDFGLTETSGTGGFLAYGVQTFAAVSAMILNRVLSLASALVIALVGMVFLHDELRRALQERPHHPQQPALPRNALPDEAYLTASRETETANAEPAAQGAELVSGHASGQSH
jgi:uncharacterized membrane protein YbhN (UPF0104 family)